MNIRPGFRRRRPDFPLILGPAPSPRPVELRAFRWSDLEPMMEIERASFPTPLSELRMRQVLEKTSVVAGLDSGCDGSGRGDR